MRRHDDLSKHGFLVLKNFENHKLHVVHVHHSSKASGTLECLYFNLLLTRIINETTIFKEIFNVSKYRNFIGGNLSLTLSIHILLWLQKKKPTLN